MQGSKKQDKKTKVIEILEKNGWSSDYPQVKQVKLYRDDVELKRSNIIAHKDKKTIIIEIEEDSTPKNLIGTIGGINISNRYKIKEGDLKPLNDISLFIIIPEMSESKGEQIKTIKKYFKIGEGSLKDFKIVTIEEFEKLL
jgi:hypothetical protein